MREEWKMAMGAFELEPAWLDNRIVESKREACAVQVKSATDTREDALFLQLLDRHRPC
jgi:hypothetical protein